MSANVNISNVEIFDRKQTSVGFSRLKEFWQSLKALGRRLVSPSAREVVIRTQEISRHHHVLR